MRVIARQVLHRLAMGHPERLERLRGMAAEAVLVVGTPGRKGIPCKLNLAENVTAYRSLRYVDFQVGLVKAQHPTAQSIPGLYRQPGNMSQHLLHSDSDIRLNDQGAFTRYVDFFTFKFILF